MISFLNHFSYNATLQNQLSEIVRSKSAHKGERLQDIGTYNPNLYFVKKGCLRSYSIDEKGREHVFTFAPEHWIITDIANEVEHRPTRLFIDAVEHSELEIIPKFKLQKILDNFGENYERRNRKLLQRIAVLQDRVLLLMSASALERYEHFVATYPNLLNRVPQKMIASYLGITPQAFSTLKKKQLQALKKPS